MWRMLQQDSPDDYVIATGEMHSVQELIDVAFGLVGLDPGKHVRIDERYFRPTEVDELQGDASKARARLGWQPRVTFHELVRLMLEADLRESGIDPATVLKATTTEATTTEATTEAPATQA
jgi:GDPmannose 4,6-dehydratase